MAKALSLQAVALDRIDGVTLEFAHWRCNLCKSNTGRIAAQRGFPARSILLPREDLMG